jgi:hypothetical protein
MVNHYAKAMPRPPIRRQRQQVRLADHCLIAASSVLLDAVQGAVLSELTADSHMRANMTWMLDNDRSFSASEEAVGLAAALHLVILDLCRARSYVTTRGIFHSPLCTPPSHAPAQVR